MSSYADRREGSLFPEMEKSKSLILTSENAFLKMEVTLRSKGGLFRASTQALLRASLPQARIFSVVPEACVITDFNWGLLQDVMSGIGTQRQTFTKCIAISTWKKKLRARDCSKSSSLRFGNCLLNFLNAGVYVLFYLGVPKPQDDAPRLLESGVHYLVSFSVLFYMFLPVAFF